MYHCIGHQCTKSNLTVSSYIQCNSQSPDLQTGVSYTCNAAVGDIVWSSKVFDGHKEFTVSYTSVETVAISLINSFTIGGLSATEIHNSDPFCFKSTITFHGSGIKHLDGNLISCRTANENSSILMSSMLNLL